ncbi:hypothetical protein ACQEVM_29835 [Streptomyces sp. CA-243310]|uniref:hypothetical protein n=1 Tax=Streptomyces sp. CA-243310 TaxID=3240056 RepID=UPI003D929B13
MLRGLVHAMAWTLSTAAAVTLSWWGVHTVMSGTAYDPPLAVPLTAVPLSSSTHHADPPSSPAPPPASPSPSASSSAPSPSAVPSAGKSKPPSASPSPRPYRQPDGGSGGDDVKGYSVSGGRVAFDIGKSSAELVSATPAAGWRMQVWKQDFWIRVTFTKEGREVSVFCTWHDTAPRVEIVDP